MLLRHRFRFALAVACVLSGLFAAAAAAQKTELRSPGALTDKLRATVAAANLGDGIGISVVDLTSGNTLFEHQAHKPLNPASNQKLVTAAVTLQELGPAFRMRTGLYGQIEGDGVKGGLFLRGFGDPTLRAADLIAMAQELVARGIRKVDEVVVDGSYFDDQVLPPAFEQQPDEQAPFRAAVAAVSVNENAYTLSVTPGATPGSRAHVHVDGEGYFEITSSLSTSEGGPPNVIAVQNAKEDQLVLRVSGQAPAGIGTLSYRRRVDSPMYFAGHVLIDALKALRVQVPRRVRLAGTPASARLLASHSSPALTQVLFALGKESDNFVAEMLLKVLAAEKVKQPGSSQEGAAFALATLKKLGVDTENLEIVNGSGLFDGNHISAGQITQLLAAMYSDMSVRADYLAQLSIGGFDGTLEGRLGTLPVARSVRAKTGTLNDVIALSGYVLGPSPERAVAFSVLANGVSGKRGAARSLADQLATAIASYLWTAR